MNTAENVWKKLLKASARVLPKQATDIWLQSCAPLRMESGKLILDAGNTFVQNKIRDNFKELLDEVMCQEGLGTEIILSVERSEENADAQTEQKTSVKQQNIGANGLNPQYEFSTFVVGKSNRLAHAASLAVAETPGEAYNPLFIWGGVGLGKTHLMHAIGNHAQSKNPNIKVAYVSSEKFTNDLITAIKNNRAAEFKSKYRNMDVLLIDDIQFLAGKESTQDEFFHTFNELHTAKKQIVLSSDRPPKELGDIEERLVSRFEWGLVTDIQQPDYETRIAILKTKAEKRRIPINDDVINFLAQNIPSNIRELEGALNRVIANSHFTGETITIEHTQKWLKDIIGNGHRGPQTVQNILEIVASEFGFSAEDICGKRRTAEVALARQTAMYMCRQHTELSLQQIAKAFGKKDHTTVLHAIRKIEILFKEDDRIKIVIKNIEKKWI